MTLVLGDSWVFVEYREDQGGWPWFCGLDGKSYSIDKDIIKDLFNPSSHRIVSGTWTNTTRVFYLAKVKEDKVVKLMNTLKEENFHSPTVLESL